MHSILEAGGSVVANTTSAYRMCLGVELTDPSNTSPSSTSVCYNKRKFVLVDSGQQQQQHQPIMATTSIPTASCDRRFELSTADINDNNDSRIGPPQMKMPRNERLLLIDNADMPTAYTNLVQEFCGSDNVSNLTVECGGNNQSSDSGTKETIAYVLYDNGFLSLLSDDASTETDAALDQQHHHHNQQQPEEHYHEQQNNHHHHHHHHHDDHDLTDLLDLDRRQLFFESTTTATSTTTTTTTTPHATTSSHVVNTNNTINSSTDGEYFRCNAYTTTTDDSLTQDGRVELVGSENVISVGGTDELVVQLQHHVQSQQNQNTRSQQPASNTSGPNTAEDNLEDRNLSWLFNFKLDELPHLSPEVGSNNHVAGTIPQQQQPPQKQTRANRRRSSSSQHSRADIRHKVDEIIKEATALEALEQQQQLQQELTRQQSNSPKSSDPVLPKYQAQPFVKLQVTAIAAVNSDEMTPMM